MSDVAGVDDSICTPDDSRENQCPGWYRLKQYVESRGAGPPSTTIAASPLAPGGDNGSSTALTESWMHQFLRPVEDLLSHKYAAVGVLEEFDVTLALFNATLQMPDLDWATSFQKIGTKNADRRFARDKVMGVAQAWADPDIEAYLWLDVLLYGHADGVFNRQATAHGLM